MTELKPRCVTFSGTGAGVTEELDIATVGQSLKARIRRRFCRLPVPLPLGQHVPEQAKTSSSVARASGGRVLELQQTPPPKQS